ncbi:DUF4349 domain-containing protein [Flavobacterium sp. UBA6135]|uniref:DUF4349 domain-containing protein n=1 Tax=Flavobacterium sp. UBA6135 TaxID=1946553 RepID=UPI0025C40774|nr:DUF4349 domain-containing protein [Flavobacterium sp. UBA6135]
MKTIIAYLSFLVLPLACGGNPDYETSVVGETMPVMEEMDSKIAINDTKFEAPDLESKIIREASLRYETQDLKTTYEQILSGLKKHNAYLQNDSEGKDYNSIYKHLIIRIPNKNFDAFLNEIGKDVAYFDRKEISSRDVTAEYIDLSARIKAKKTLEERYLELLKKAVKVSEILEIEKELSAIREEIEAKEGQLNYLQNKISLSTIQIEFYKKVAKADYATVSYGTKMWNAIKSGWNGISSFLIGLLHIWPFILILVAIFIFVRKTLKRKNQ